MNREHGELISALQTLRARWETVPTPPLPPPIASDVFGRLSRRQKHRRMCSEGPLASQRSHATNFSESQTIGEHSQRGPWSVEDDRFMEYPALEKDPWEVGKATEEMQILGDAPRESEYLTDAQPARETNVLRDPQPTRETLTCGDASPARDTQYVRVAPPERETLSLGDAPPARETYDVEETQSIREILSLGDAPPTQEILPGATREMLFVGEAPQETQYLSNAAPSKETYSVGDPLLTRDTFSAVDAPPTRETYVVGDPQPTRESPYVIVDVPPERETHSLGGAPRESEYVTDAPPSRETHVVGKPPLDADHVNVAHSAQKSTLPDAVGSKPRETSPPDPEGPARNASSDADAKGKCAPFFSHDFTRGRDDDRRRRDSESLGEWTKGERHSAQRPGRRSLTPEGHVGAREVKVVGYGGDELTDGSRLSRRQRPRHVATQSDTIDVLDAVVSTRFCGSLERGQFCVAGAIVKLLLSAESLQRKRQAFFQWRVWTLRRRQFYEECTMLECAARESMVFNEERLRNRIISRCLRDGERRVMFRAFFEALFEAESRQRRVISEAQSEAMDVLFVSAEHAAATFAASQRRADESYFWLAHSNLTRLLREPLRGGHRSAQSAQRTALLGNAAASALRWRYYVRWMARVFLSQRRALKQTRELWRSVHRELDETSRELRRQSRQW